MKIPKFRCDHPILTEAYADFPVATNNTHGPQQLNAAPLIETPQCFGVGYPEPLRSYRIPGR